MCLYVESLTTKPKRLSKDMLVYKVLAKRADGTLVSPFRGAPYKIGEVVKSKLDKPVPEGLGLEHAGINRGIHGFLNKEDALYLVDEVDEFVVSVGEELKVFKARIPKGSSVYIGTFEGYEPSFASTRLIIDGEVVP